MCRMLLVAIQHLIIDQVVKIQREQLLISGELFVASASRPRFSLTGKIASARIVLLLGFEWQFIDFNEILGARVIAVTVQRVERRVQFVAFEEQILCTKEPALLEQSKILEDQHDLLVVGRPEFVIACDLGRI